MSAPDIEFSRPIALARIGPHRLRETIAANGAERAALCRRFGLLALDRLTAEVELSRERGPRSRGSSGGGDVILLRAAFAAAFVQSCVVTLEPVPGELSQNFALRYGPPDAEMLAGVPEAIEITGDEAETFEPLDGETIDIGEAVAQEFSLALPAFPRVPGAEPGAEEVPG
jgi:hypothetical protein